MWTTFAAQSFAWQAFIVAVFAVLALLLVVGVVTGHAMYREARTWLADDPALRNVEPVDQQIVREQLDRWVRLGDRRAPCRVVPLPIRRTLQTEDGREIEAEAR